ncbi:MAG: HAD-IIA family hydrolase [Oscillospiraceae bacterium]|nr:HAD-IIA family hydrolase [Oscillospiraceae bacterium]
MPDATKQGLATLRAKQGFICDMDGVIYHGNRLLDGVERFVDWMVREDKRFLFLTNSSERAPKELQAKLGRMGLTVNENHFYTSALATASFLRSQAPGATLYVIGEPGLVGALYEAGFTMNDVSPDYVVVGETRAYSFEKIEHAIGLVLGGAKLIATNPDLTGPSERGIIPACRALVAPIELASGRAAYYVGKPNPLMMRHAIKRLGVPVDQTVIIGDRMDTDIIAGIESEIDTVLVLSGVTARERVKDFPYRPHYIFGGVGGIPPLAGEV